MRTTIFYPHFLSFEHWIVNSIVHTQTLWIFFFIIFSSSKYAKVNTTIITLTTTGSKNIYLKKKCYSRCMIPIIITVLLLLNITQNHNDTIDAAFNIFGPYFHIILFRWNVLCVVCCVGRYITNRPYVYLITIIYYKVMRVFIHDDASSFCCSFYVSFFFWKLIYCDLTYKNVNENWKKCYFLMCVDDKVGGWKCFPVVLKDHSHIFDYFHKGIHFYNLFIFDLIWKL